MNYDLIKIRVLSFLYQVGTALVLLVVAYISSPDFASLVGEHFGAIAAALVALVIPEVVKHYRNKLVLGKWQQLGGNSWNKPTLI